VTLVNFGLFDLLGLQLSPRMRNLGKITLYRAGPMSEATSALPLTGPLLTRKLNTELIAEHWDDLLRLAGPLKFGHATASLLVGKLSARLRGWTRHPRPRQPVGAGPARARPAVSSRCPRRRRDRALVGAPVPRRQRVRERGRVGAGG
jgi:hypothetical protein